MANNIKWRFPSNSYASTTGLNTADIETFMKDANAALAREIAQNSIDAKIKENNNPVKIDFKSFTIKRDKIPGLNDIIDAINNCIEYWEEFGSPKTVDALKEMLKELNRANISCLRISDYNTTGLIGVSKLENSPWHNLIHGTGVSEKSSTSGGSKGIGKFATFVNSYFRTVFYSTKTEKGEVGYEGICKLCSGKIPGTDQLTQGIGYYSSSEKNEPILSEFTLDSTHKRTDKQYGTDIYIIGFKNESNWKEEIACKVLDSFMSAIVYNTLEVTIDEIIINSNTLKKTVYNEKIVRNKTDKQKIISQYLLLTDSKTHIEDIEVPNLGSVKLFVRTFEDYEADLATNKCTMIRYPYMKIKDRAIQTLVKISALCIIPDNRLNEKLRAIENPQHVDWEFNRIDNPIVRNDFKHKIETLYKQINEIITSFSLKDTQTMTEVVGTENFISRELQEEELDLKVVMKKNEVAKPTEKFRPKPKHTKGKNIDSNDQNDIPEYGQFDPGDYEAEVTKKENKKNEQKEEEKEKEEKEQKNKLKKKEIRGIKFVFMCLDKKQSLYQVSFISNVDVENAEIIILGQDEGNFSINLNIFDCTVNDEQVLTYDGQLIKINLVKENKYNIKFKTAETLMFACWVKAYEYKE